jgi:hypothetical protein
MMRDTGTASRVPKRNINLVRCLLTGYRSPDLHAKHWQSGKGNPAQLLPFEIISPL